jgi:hypothetical protein
MYACAVLHAALSVQQFELQRWWKLPLVVDSVIRYGSCPRQIVAHEVLAHQHLTGLCSSTALACPQMSLTEVQVQ